MQEQIKYLENKNRELELIISATNTATWEWNIVTGETRFNERWAEIVGYTLSELQPTTINTWLNLCHPDDLKISEAAINRHFSGESDFYDCECRMRHKSGHYVWVHDKGKLIERTPQGTPLRMLGTHSDITKRKLQGEKLEAEKNKFQKILETMQVGLFVVNAKTHIIEETNSVAASLTKTPVEHIIGRMCHRFVCPAEQGKCPITDQHQTVHNAERTLLTIDDKSVPILKTVVPVMLDGENKLIETFVDLSKQKQLERKLLERETNFRNFFETIDDILLVANAEGAVVQFNKATSQKLGYSEDQLYNKPVLDFHPPELRAEAASIFGDMLAEKRTSCPLPLITSNGQLIPVETRVWQGEWNGQAAIFGVSKDLSAQQEAIAKFKKIFDSNPTPMAISSMPDRRFIDVNEAFLNLLKFERDEVIGKTSSELNLFAEAESQIRVANELTKNGHVKNIELTVRDRQGETHDGLFSGELLESAGKRYFLTVMTDITVHNRMTNELRKTNRQLELATAEAQQANQAKSEFLANMSHEIRTPMNGIIGSAQLLLRSNMNSVQQRFAETIVSSGLFLLEVINDILDYSKIEANKLELENVDFNINDLLDEVAVSFSSRTAEKNIEIVLSVNPKLASHMRGDRHRLRQILNNLVGNAVKFTQQGEVVIECDTVAENETHTTFKFVVNDTGIGIPPHRLELIFEKFSQVDSSVTRNFGGSGLGLAISKHLVEKMGGKIGVSSTVGQGSQFWFTLELAKQHHQEPENEAFLGKRALVVSHSGSVSDALTKQLCHWKIKTTNAPNFDSAKNAMQSTELPFDAIFIDFDLPSGAALTLIKQIQSENFHNLSRTVVMAKTNALSVLADLSHASKLVNILKPTTRSDLLKSLQTVFQPPNEQSSSYQATRSLEQNTPLQKRPEKILLVEDNETNRMIALAMLEELGFQAHTAHDGAEALKELSTKDFDLVLMDVQMPVMDGYEATRQIRSGTVVRNPKIPVLGLTANALAGEEKKCLDAGMNAHLSKPVVIAKLETTIYEWLSQKHKTSAIPTASNATTQTLHAFNPNSLLMRVSNHEHVATKIVDVFLSDVTKMSQTLERHLLAQDAHNSEISAHALKGAAAAASAEIVSQLALKVEESAKSGDFQSARSAMASLPNAVADCRVAIQLWKKVEKKIS
jgi:PAS domain S-box-containing protein